MYVRMHKELVASIEELMGFIRILFSEIKSGAQRSLPVRGLPNQILDRFGRRVDPRVLGHKKLKWVVKDPRFTSEFVARDLCLYEVLPEISHALR